MRDNQMPRTLADVMTRNAKWVSPGDSIRHAAEMMRSEDIGALPVVDDGTLRGLLTDRDIVIRAIADGVPADTPLGPFISTDIVTGSPDMALADAAALMSRAQVRRLPVVQGGRLVGIVSMQDVAQNADSMLVGQVEEAITEEV